MTETRGHRKERKGEVISRAGDKTVTVRVARRFRHPTYGKVMTAYQTCHAHDEQNQAQVGSTVLIVETRPISRLKRWRVVEILAAAQA